METVIGDDVLASTEWQQRLDTLAAEHRVPGAQIGLLQLRPDGSVDQRVLTTGVTSLATQVEVTADTLFQWGSITKVWTTTLIMQLVEQGRLDLEARVVDVLDGFTMADPGAAAEITVRQLLHHTSGIDGDVFTDTGDGDECVARYVDELSGAISVTAPGEHLSYCNAGFVVAGRITEVLYDKPWDDVLAEQLFRPLGIDHAITRAKDAPLFRTAVGHLGVSAGSDEVVPTRTWMLPRSMGPAGLIAGSAEALLTFAAAHLNDGLGLNGTRILSPESVAAMREPQVDLTSVSSTQLGWGLGWSLEAWDSRPVPSHGGGTIGQISALHTFPERGLALVILTNSRGGPGLIKDLEAAIGADLQLDPPRPRKDSGADQVDLSHLVGSYESSGFRWTIAATDAGLQLSTERKIFADGEPDPPPAAVSPLGEGRFSVIIDEQPMEVSHVRLGSREFLYFGRLLERTS